jgi:RNA polymerase sigma factor (sigma-70 family)
LGDARGSLPPVAEAFVSNAHGKEFILTDYAKTLIEFKARQLSRRRGIGQSDRDEIQQELWLAVVNQADRFDPSRASLDTFIDRVVNTGVAIVLRDRERQKRAMGFRAASLDTVLKDADCSKPPLAAKITEDDHHRRLGTERRDEHDDRERAEAVASALGHMPPAVSDVCRRVMGGSISSAAEELKTSRRQIRKSLDVARQHFQDAGIDNA